MMAINLERVEQVVQDIQDVEARLEAMEARLEVMEAQREDVAYLWQKEELKKQRRREKKVLLMQLREESIRAETSEQPSKWPKTAPNTIQLFAQSAAESYRKWARDYKLALPKVGEDPEEMRRPFLELKIDPLQNFHYGFLLWVRECYRDMKDILSAAKPGQRFTILGTSGIGQSLFTVFWICYRATLNEKVVWKHGEEAVYLLDFSAEPSAKAYDLPSLHHQDILEVLDDENAWLVITGRQPQKLACRCKIVQACSMGKEKYKRFAKNQKLKLQYFPVWEEEEIRQFLDEFEQHRLKYKDMDVPIKDDALRYFQKIGGVPRYVLCGRKTEKRLKEVESVVWQLSGDTCLKYLAGNFEEGGEASEALVHIKRGWRKSRVRKRERERRQQSEDKKYSDYTFDCASFYVRCQFIERFEQASKVNMVHFLRDYANSTEVGNNYGYVFEFVAHDLFKRGGQFRMKRVMQGGDPKGEELAPLKVPSPVKVVFFESLEKLPRFEADTYYRPQAVNLKSIDAVFHPDYLLSYKSGVHGYMVKGLQEVDVALGLSKYKVCSCVPIDKYNKTGFQPWLSTIESLYKAVLPKMIKDSEQYVIGVDYNNFSS